LLAIGKLDHTSRVLKQAKATENNRRHVHASNSTKHYKKAERKENYKIVKSEMDDWQPIIKKNREARHLDFTENHKVAKFNLNASKQKALKGK